MSQSGFRTRNCKNCGKETVVARVSPCSEPGKLTGMWLYRMSEDFGQETVGVLCKDCAFKMCVDGKVSLGFCGGRGGNLDNWEALLT